MTDTAEKTEQRDYSDTLYLPKTEFPMRAGLPKKEPEILARWQEMDLYKKLREDAAGRPKYVLHDGPPYANGNLHIGHALNKILKDIITKSFQMRGYDSNYVPGWDCHGLPIEWKIEEQYRSKGKNKDEVPTVEFRKECRDFASHWVGVQSDEFQRLGVVGDFKDPYLTMAYGAEAIIADELMKFAKSGQLYRGSKPIMWSVVERTALAEAEIEYQTYESDTVWVKFPVLAARRRDGSEIVRGMSPTNLQPMGLDNASVLIWTTTPWTIPANRAISFSRDFSYGVYLVVESENDFGPQNGEKFIVADSLASECAEKAKLRVVRQSDVNPRDIAVGHPLRDQDEYYRFFVPMLEGDHVTDDAGTGFVHTAPSHGRDDFEIWVRYQKQLIKLGAALYGDEEERRSLDKLTEEGLATQIETSIPFPIADDGTYTSDAPGFEGARVIDDKGKKGDANQKVITALIEANNLFARGRLKHDYPHSWRSKKPIIFRNTPQWFVHMDKEGATQKGTLRDAALSAIEDTRFVPERGKTRLHGMIAERPDWVLSRQRAWGVPITVFRHEETGQIIPGPDFGKSDELSERIKTAFAAEGADCWYEDGAKERFLDGFVNDLEKWEKVDDILDVWFDSGSTHAFCLEQRDDLKWPADIYLEGSDQHRGWFHSSLLESCGTRGRAPYDTVLTHGFTMAEDGRKMSKSLNNQVAPQDVIKQYGADILRLWVSSVDYAEDQRIGPEIIKTAVDSYRKLRNTLRWMLGTLAHDKGEDVAVADMPELERLMLHRLAELDELVRIGYDNFDFKRIFAALNNFMNVELSAFYFDVRKDALYCDAPSSTRRKAALRVVSQLFDCLTTWMAPMLSYTMEEAWTERHPDRGSVHLQQFPDVPAEWRDDVLTAKWQKIRRVRRVVTGALEIERREKRIGSSLEAAPVVHITDSELMSAIGGQDMAEICITSQIEITGDPAPADAFTLEEVSGVAVVNQMAEGTKCARSWKVLPEVGTDPDYPDITLRDADAMREIGAA